MAASKAKSEKLPLLKSNLDGLNKVHNLERSTCCSTPIDCKMISETY